MRIGSDPLDRLSIPDGTTVEEHDLVTEGNVIVGGQSTVAFGVRGHSVMAGERVSFGGHIEAEGDCRLDMWCEVTDNVLVGENAYLGERVHIGGQLKVAGDLDIGDDVDIEDGFEANGWIVIRNPMPTIVFLFVYLSQLLRIGEEEAAEEVLQSLTEDDGPDHDPLLIPRGANVNDDVWRVSTPATVGDDCRLHGNVRAASLDVGRNNTIFGSLRAKEDVVVGRGSDIKGDVTTRNGDVRIGPGVKVWGDVVARDVALHENATVDGTIRASGEMEMHTDEVIDRPDETAEAMAAAAEELTGETEAESAEIEDGESDDDVEAEGETAIADDDSEQSTTDDSERSTAADDSEQSAADADDSDSPADDDPVEASD